MGFNLMSFLGGAASAGTRGIEQRKAQRAKEKETAEARQWQIATEARADARARKKQGHLKKDKLKNVQKCYLYTIQKIK